MAYSASDAAFEGFRITREKPMAVGAWALVQLVAAVVAALLTVFLIGPEMAALIEFNKNPPSDPAAVQAMLPALLKVLGVGAPVRMIVWAVLVCAIYRAVLRPQDKAFGYLRLGGDELRQILLSVIVSLILIVAMIGASVVLVLVAAVAGLATQAASDGAAAGLAMLITLASLVGLAAVSAWVLVRLSLTGPLTLVRGKLAIAEGWALTRGRFWQLFGTYLIAFVLAVVVALLGWAIILAISLAVGGGFGVMSQLQNPDFTSLQSLFTPGMTAMMICSSILSALQLTIMVAPTATAFQALGGAGASDTFA